MRKLKKALSMTLALALSLALAVPAFADEGVPIPEVENNWNLEVAGKADEEVLFAGEKTFKLHDWTWSDYDENEIRTVTKADVSEYTPSQLIIPKKGDTVVITNGGAEFSGLDLQAWSDPDGDGVYDSRLMEGYMRDTEDGMEGGEELKPADIAGPLASSYPFAGEQWYFNLFYIQQAVNVSEDGDWTADPGKVSISSGEGVWGSAAELRIPVDQLLEEFGGNTLFWIGTKSGGWYILLEDGATATEPTAPAAGTAYVVSAKQGLNVRTGPGTNYPKARAALARNTAVQVVEVQGQWGKLANDAGWVFMPGLKAVSAPVTTPTTPETPEQTFPITMVVKNSKGALNVRTGPGADYKLATVPLRNGSVITIDKIEGQWGRLANYMDWWVYLPGAKTVKG